ncbi:prolyl aminopeptidase [Rhodococcus sp. NPDC056743]|uniref:prolyl aminopeptidase n=1 Tax=Rhodococcus sp. NPDC056743 TaxID=3345934 RepID=UPI00366DEE7C
MSARLYPPVDPYESGMLDASDGQTLYWESIGNPSGIPVVYLHGGPGSGCTVGARRYFDPTRFRAVLFDQRGCGRSRPLADGPDADLTVNTTAHILDDIERLREHLGIERWIVTGLSWGVSLGLVYAQAFPERVSAMALGAITGGTHAEIEWITRSMRRVFPREWEEFIEPVPLDEREGNIAAAYARLLADPNPVVRENAAVQWCRWEDVHVSLMPGWTPSVRYENPEFRCVFTRLVTHFWSHDCFLVPNQIMDGMTRLAGIPAILVHGRYDVSGPLDTAWAIHKSWPSSELVVQGDAGHGGGGFNGAMVEALNSLGHSLNAT